MSLNKASFTNTLTSIFSDVSQGNTASSKAQAIADAIDAYIKTATVSVNVTTTGTATAQTGTGTGTLS